MRSMGPSVESPDLGSGILGRTHRGRARRPGLQHCALGVREEGIQHGHRVRDLCQGMQEGKEPCQGGILPDKEPGLLCEETDVHAPFVAFCTCCGTVFGLELGELAVRGGECLFESLRT